MAQIPKLMARLQFGLQFNTVPRRPSPTVHDPEYTRNEPGHVQRQRL